MQLARTAKQDQGSWSDGEGELGLESVATCPESSGKFRHPRFSHTSLCCCMSHPLAGIGSQNCPPVHNREDPFSSVHTNSMDGSPPSPCPLLSTILHTAGFCAEGNLPGGGEEGGRQDLFGEGAAIGQEAERGTEASPDLHAGADFPTAEDHRGQISSLETMPSLTLCPAMQPCILRCCQPSGVAHVGM